MYRQSDSRIVSMRYDGALLDTVALPSPQTNTTTNITTFMYLYLCLYLWLWLCLYLYLFHLGEINFQPCLCICLCPCICVYIILYLSVQTHANSLPDNMRASIFLSCTFICRFFMHATRTNNCTTIISSFAVAAKISRAKIANFILNK